LRLPGGAANQWGMPPHRNDLSGEKTVSLVRQGEVRKGGVTGGCLCGCVIVVSCLIYVLSRANPCGKRRVDPERRLG
jgi:hypothetical protein